MLRNSGRKWTRFSGGRGRESRWDNMNLPNSRVGMTGNEDRSGSFCSPGGSEITGRFPNEVSDNSFQFGSPFEVRERRHFQSEPWEQRSQLTPSNGFNYPDIRFSSGSPTFHHSATPFIDPNFSTNFQNSTNQNSYSFASNFNDLNSTPVSGNINMNFSGNRNPESPSFSSGNQIFNNSVNQQPAAVTNSSSKLLIFPSMSSTNKRVNPFSFANQDSQQLSRTCIRKIRILAIMVKIYLSRHLLATRTSFRKVHCQ